LGHFEKQNKNTWKVLKYGEGEVLRSSVGPIEREIKKYYIKQRMTRISYIQNVGRLTELVTPCVGTVFWNTLLNERQNEGKK
jgi:hypothetical protein